MRSKEMQGFSSEGVQKRGGITPKTVAFNLKGIGILDWGEAFSVPDQEYITFKRGFGYVRVEIIRGFQAELNNHKREYVNAGEHVITESPKGNLKTSQGIVVDGMEVPFISSEIEFMIKEMLDGLPMSKSEYFEEMKRKRFEEPEEILKRNINFLNKYFHLGLTLQEGRINGTDKYLLKIPETTKVRFGEESTRQ